MASPPANSGTLPHPPPGDGDRRTEPDLQAALNPPAENKGGAALRDWVYREGDRVMQVRNNYDILWREKTRQRRNGMFKRDIGVIQTVEQESILVDFEGKLVEYAPEIMLERAGAGLCHHRPQKVPGQRIPGRSFWRRWTGRQLDDPGVLYTALPGLGILLIIVGEEQTVAGWWQTTARAPVQRPAGPAG